MGMFATNIHLRGVDAEQTIKALQSLNARPAFVSRAVGNWVSVYPKPLESKIDATKLTSGHLSLLLHCATIAFYIHDSDLLMYWCFDDGVEIDRYNSNPGYFETRSLPPEGGNAEVLLQYCRSGTSMIELNRVLHMIPTRLDTSPDESTSHELAARLRAAQYLRDALKARPPNQHPLNPVGTDPLADITKPFDPGDLTPAENIAKRLAHFIGISSDCIESTYSSLAADSTPSLILIRVL